MQVGGPCGQYMQCMQAVHNYGAGMTQLACRCRSGGAYHRQCIQRRPYAHFHVTHNAWMCTGPAVEAGGSQG